MNHVKVPLFTKEISNAVILRDFKLFTFSCICPIKDDFNLKNRERAYMTIWPLNKIEENKVIRLCKIMRYTSDELIMVQYLL